MTLQELIDALSTLPMSARSAHVAGSRNFEPIYEMGIVYLEIVDEDDEEDA